MKTYQEFKNFCNIGLASNLKDLDDERNKLIIKLLVFRTLFGLMILGIGFILLITESISKTLEDNDVLMVLAILGIIIYIILMILIFSHQRKLRNVFVMKFKNNLIQKIVKFFDESFIYNPLSFISLDEFKNSGLIPKRIDKYYGDDLVEGKIEKTNFIFSEIHALVEERSGDNKKHYVEVFGGILFIADFNKNFKGKTVILPDKIEKQFGGGFAKFFQNLVGAYGDLVKLEDVDFEKEFVVYSSDQIEARYILSTSLMSRILQFKNKLNRDLMMSFVDSKVYVGLQFKGKLFEPKIFGKLIAEESLKVYYDQFNLCLSIVEDLNLNLRIWNKE